MFKLIKTELYDGFQCAMDACPDNCCDEDWEVQIDEETYRKYLDIGFTFPDDKISSGEPHIIKKDPETGRCPFISAEGLCTLHVRYGETLLSNTCRSYPRFVTDYGPIIIETLGISCPVVAGTLLRLDHVLCLKEEVYYETQEEVGEPYNITEAESRMKSCVAVFSEPEKDVISCLKACLENVDDGKGMCLPALQPETKAIAGQLADRHLYLEKNIALSYLFEHLMLETKSASPDYAAVIGECVEVIHAFRQALSESVQDGNLPDEKEIIRILYRLMRVMDHQTFSL